MNILIQALINGVLSMSIIANIAALSPIYVADAEALLPVIEEQEEANLTATAPMQEEVKRMTVDMTAYSSTEDQTDDSPFITASGAHVADGIVAANFLPLHTRVKIPSLYGEKVFVVEDRMNRRYTQRMDIWMETREEAMKFGLKKAEIVVLK